MSKFGRNVCTRLNWTFCARVLFGPAKLNCPPGFTPFTSGKPVGCTVVMSLSEYLPNKFHAAEKRWSIRPSRVEASCGRTGDEAKLVTLTPGPFGNGYIAAIFCAIGSSRPLYGARSSLLNGTAPAGTPPNAVATLSCCDVVAQMPLLLNPAVQFSEKSPTRCFAVGTTAVIGMPCRMFSPS